VDTLGFAGNEALVSGNKPNLPSIFVTAPSFFAKKTQGFLEIVRQSSMLQCKQLN